MSQTEYDELFDALGLHPHSHAGVMAKEIGRSLFSFPPASVQSAIDAAQGATDTIKAGWRRAQQPVGLAEYANPGTMLGVAGTTLAGGLPGAERNALGALGGKGSSISEIAPKKMLDPTEAALLGIKDALGGELTAAEKTALAGHQAWVKSKATAPKKLSELTEEGIAQYLNDNPGASIFDIAGVGKPVTSKVASTYTPQYEPPVANALRPELPPGATPIQLETWRATSPYTTPAFRGTGQPPRQRPEIEKRKGYLSPGPDSEHGAWFSAANPELSNMYAQYYHSGTHGTQQRMPQSQPLMLDTRDYHVHDAQGFSWDTENAKAISAARKAGKPGVIIKNVQDEPNTSSTTGSSRLKPQTVYVTLPEGMGTARSKFAQFNPLYYGKNDLLASIAGSLGLGNMLMPRKEDSR